MSDWIGDGAVRGARGPRHVQGVVRGSDIIHLLDPALGFKAYCTGSNLVLTSPDTTITIPIGMNATMLDFDGAALALRYDTAAGDEDRRPVDHRHHSRNRRSPGSVGAGGAGLRLSPNQR
ncbi:MAG: hypothetical protein ACO1O3_04700 [Sphingobium sp.]